MEESKRQKQVARLIQEELSNSFQKEGLTMINGGMVSIAQVQMTPDLLEARIYLSFYKVTDVDSSLTKILEMTPQLRHQVGNKLRHRLRRIPELVFIKDIISERASKMEDLLNKIRNDEKDAPPKND